MLLLYMAVLGLILGSFINALVWRIHEEKDIVNDRSECETCHSKLEWYELIPLFSWLIQRGKCRHCGAKVSIQNPAVELALALIFVGLCMHFGVADKLAIIQLVYWVVASTALVALVVYDLRWMLLPVAISYPLVAMTIIYTAIMGAVGGNSYVQDGVLGFVALVGTFSVFYIYSKGKWLGEGDITFAMFMGLALGWAKSLLALFTASWVGIGVYLSIAVFKRKSIKKLPIPFIPLLTVGVYLALFYGTNIIDWYIKHFLTY